MTDRMLQFFAHNDMPDNEMDVAIQFDTLAHQVVKNLPRTPERTVCLRKLLEARDCALRCLIEDQHVG
jgi:hypothetical protein